MTPGLLVLGVLITRQLLDLSTALELGGMPLNRLGTAASLVVLASVSLRYRTRPPADLLLPAVTFLLTVMLAALHPSSMAAASRHGLLLAAPVLVGWATWCSNLSVEQLLRAACLGALLPVATSLVALGLGQQHDLVSHGYARLTGLYANHHTLGLTAGLTVILAVAASTRARGAARVLLGALAVGAAVVAVATWVRTVLVLWGVTAVSWALLTRQWRPLLAGSSLFGLVVMVSPSAHERVGDMLAVLTLTPPEQGWTAVGSWRGAIWRDSLTAFQARGPLLWLTGLGLGGHLELWSKPLDPHSEPLTLWFQLGVIGPLSWLLMHAAAARRVWRAAEPDRSLVLALLAGALATCLVSNTFVARPTLGWWLWALAAAAARDGWTRAQTREGTAGRPARG